MAVKQIISDSFEFIKETGQKAGQIVPDVFGGMLEQAVHGPKQTSAQKQQAKQKAQAQIAQKQNDFAKKDEEELKKQREKLEALRRMQATYAPRPAQEKRPYEATIADMERKKAMEAEMQKRQAAGQIITPSSKPNRGMRKQKAKGMEGLAKDTKSG